MRDLANAGKINEIKTLTNLSQAIIIKEIATHNSTKHLHPIIISKYGHRRKLRSHRQRK